jgi:ParB-like chromosome segregation protein Spo0J
MKNNIEKIKKILNEVRDYTLDDKVIFLNAIKQMAHEVSPFKDEPVDCVLWVKNEQVIANDYNPNKVAPPEMELLEVSIDNDGYTQPIVTYPHDSKLEVIDGFHRSRVGKESIKIKEKVHGYLPIVAIRHEKEGKNERIASTIRHNRARGKHQIDAMSEIILELKNRNWKNSRIARELGMDEDEILRLCQITGLESLFTDKDFSNAWEAGDSISEYDVLTDEVTEQEYEETRTANTNDPDRIFHTFDKWECNKAGFYASQVEGKNSTQCEEEFAKFFRTNGLFEKTVKKVLKEWKYSCEHYLTNTAMNRIAWLGQASVCYVTGIPSKFSAGWFLLTNEQQEHANEVALKALNKWLKENGRKEIEMNEALSVGRQVEIY